MRARKPILLRIAGAVLGFAAMLLAARDAGSANELPAELATRLTAEQQHVYLDYRKARSAHERRHKAYWQRVEDKREARKAKRLLGQAYDSDDYIAQHPPKYSGPELPAEIAQIATQVRPPPAPAPPLPDVGAFLAHAKTIYQFTPATISDPDFKRSYAREALAAGLSKDQVVRIYALETGGMGTFETLSGINPVTGQGRPISSALGYAQLLHANSVGGLVTHGEAFIRRLTAMANAPGNAAERADALKSKAAVLRRMLRAARKVANEWSAHVQFANTPEGLGIHAINLDGDVGPWLQVLKLKSLKDTARDAGRGELSGSEMELMNLAGPRTGLEMMTPLARGVATANFFAEGAYYRNPIVRDRTAAELLDALNERMEINLKRQGSVEFAQIFDEVAGR